MESIEPTIAQFWEILTSHGFKEAGITIPYP